MTTKTTNTSLRLGLLIGDQMIDERRVARGKVVTIGQSMDCTLAIALEALPRRWVLFDHLGQLRLAPGMTANVEGEGEEKRGRVRIGDVTVLFHFVEAHEEVRVPLPRGLRPWTVDRRLAGFVAGSILLHAGIATAAWLHDGAHRRPRETPPVAMLEPSMVDLVNMVPFDPADPQREPTPAPVPPDAPPGIAKPMTPAAPITPATPHHGGHRPGLPEMSPEDYIKALHGVPQGPGDMPALPAMPGVGDDDPIVGNPDRGPRTHDPVGPKGPRDPNVPDVPDVDPLAKDPITVKPPKPEPPGDVPPPIDRDWVADVIHLIQTQYMPGLQRCQKKLLATDPLATTMTVKVSFTVKEDGSVGAHTATSDNDTVSACIKGQMATWDLPKPPSGKDAHIAVKLALQGS